MPYFLMWENNGVYKKFTGVVTGAELLQSVNEVANDMQFGKARYEVSDYLGAESTEFSQDALNEVRAVRIGSFQRNPRIRVAIRLTLHQTQVFSDVAEANLWAGRAVKAV